jgi:hypothetical protein
MNNFFAQFSKILPNIHDKICNCFNIRNCSRFYRRLMDKKKVVFHSLAYQKRQSSISYFIKYGSLFGAVLVYMFCSNDQYAIVKRYKNKKRFSDHFISFPYYALLAEPVDNFLCVLEKETLEYDVVNVNSSIYMCIIVEENDLLYVSSVFVYHEHD